MNDALRKVIERSPGSNAQAIEYIRQSPKRKGDISTRPGTRRCTFAPTCHVMQKSCKRRKLLMRLLCQMAPLGHRKAGRAGRAPPDTPTGAGAVAGPQEVSYATLGRFVGGH